MNAAVPAAKKLSGRVAVVTGGQRGLGASIIEHFLEEGATCIVNYPDASCEREALQFIESLKSKSAQVSAIKGNVGDDGEVKNLFDAVSTRYGRLDILVNNAGINPLRTWEDLDRVTWDLTVNVNLTGVFNCCHAALKIMKRQKRGNIINI